MKQALRNEPERPGNQKDFAAMRLDSIKRRGRDSVSMFASFIAKSFW